MQISPQRKLLRVANKCLRVHSVQEYRLVWAAQKRTSVRSTTTLPRVCCMCPEFERCLSAGNLFVRIFRSLKVSSSGVDCLQKLSSVCISLFIYMFREAKAVISPLPAYRLRQTLWMMFVGVRVSCGTSYMFCSSKNLEPSLAQEETFFYEMGWSGVDRKGKARENALAMARTNRPTKLINPSCRSRQAQASDQKPEKVVARLGPSKVEEETNDHVTLIGC